MASTPTPTARPTLTTSSTTRPARQRDGCARRRWRGCCRPGRSPRRARSALAEEGEVTHTPGFVRRCVAFWLDILLVTLVSLVGGGAIGLVLTMLGASEGVRSHAMDLVLYAAFLWVELVAPWRHAGSTPGGAFVRMSCETREREGARRAVFYVLRVVVLGAAYFFFPILWPVFALFFLFARRMPYDFV